MPKSNNSKIFKGNSGKPWHDELFGKVIILITIFGAGYTVGYTFKSNDHKIELLRLQYEYNQRLHEEINKYRDCKIEEQEEKLNALDNVVNMISKLKENGSTKTK